MNKLSNVEKEILHAMNVTGIPFCSDDAAIMDAMRSLTIKGLARPKTFLGKGDDGSKAAISVKYEITAAGKKADRGAK